MSAQARAASHFPRFSVRPDWFSWVFQVSVTVIALTGTAAAGRVLTAVVIELVVDHQLPLTSAVLLTCSVIVGAAAVGGLHYALSVRLAEFVERRLSAVRLRTLRAVRQLTPGRVRQLRRQILDRLSTDIDGLACFARWDARALPVGFAQLLLATGVMAVYSWPSTIAVYAGLLPLACSARYAELRLNRARVEASLRDDQFTKVARSVLLDAPTNRISHSRRDAMRQIEAVLRKRDDAALVAVRASAALTGLRELSVGIALACALSCALAMGLENGQTLAVTLLAVYLARPITTLAGSISEAGKARTHVAGLGRMLDESAKADPGDNGTALPSGPVEVRFESVSSAHSPEGGLREVSLTIPAGRVVALFGLRGSGHLAIGDLVTRLADPIAGRVLLAGVPVTEVPLDSLRQRVLALPRDGSIVDGTVGDNIRLGRANASDEAIYHACTDLGVNNWLTGLNDGLGTRVGRHGYLLNPAERHLIALIRAYLDRPDVLVIRDVYGGGPAMQAYINRALAAAVRGRTTIFITHRPSAVKIADEVNVFDRGRLVETGTYARLTGDPDTVFARHHLNRALMIRS